MGSHGIQWNPIESNEIPLSESDDAHNAIPEYEPANNDECFVEGADIEQMI